MKNKDYKAWFFIFGMLNDILINDEILNKETREINYKKLNDYKDEDFVLRNSALELYKKTVNLIKTFKRKNLKYAKEIDDYLSYTFDGKKITDGYVPEIVLVHFLKYEWFVKPFLIRPYMKSFIDNEHILIKSVVKQLNRNVVRNSYKLAENIKDYILYGKKVKIQVQIDYKPNWAKRN